jgi:LysR family transcriptional activator of nhaA
MRHLNYNHLLYFWTVAREGSIARASEALHLTPQTISGQLKLLEERVGAPLFQRVGRGLVLTETGQLVSQYADEIFALGAELTQRVRSEQPYAPVVLNVGIVNSIAKLIAYRIVEPALQMEDGLRVVCREADLERLLGDLAVHRLDLVLSDRPIPTGLNVKAYNHRLGESGIAFFAQKRLAATYRRRFPESLHGAPVLLPATATALRRTLDDWFEGRGVTPRIVAEFDDSALLKAFGEAGVGLFPAPIAIAAQVEQMYHASLVGEVDGVTESYYAISPERKLRHPAVVRITELARSLVFA